MAHHDPKYSQLQWAERPFRDDEFRTVIVPDPKALWAQMAPNLEWRPERQPGQCTYEEFYKEAQNSLLSRVREQMRQVEPLIRTLREEAAAFEKLFEAAQAYMSKQVSTLRVELLARARLADVSSWEPRFRIPPPSLRDEIESRIRTGIYQATAYQPSSAIPPIPTPRRASRRSIEYLGSTPTVPAESEEDLASADLEGLAGGQPEDLASAGREGLAGSHGSASAAGSHRSSVGGPSVPTDTPPAGVEALHSQASGGPEYPDDDSDSDPEPNPERYPKRWQSWVKRRAERHAMHNAAQFLRDVVPQAPPQPVQLSEHKVADPKHFKGDPEDLDRFLHQLEDKFSLEPSRFKTDIFRIRYTGSRLEGKAYKWYKSYHLHISSHVPSVLGEPAS